MANYLVTGGCGFIGSHLCDRLTAEGHAVRVLDDLSTGSRDRLGAGVELIVGDVADIAVVECALAGMDGCFHLAGIGAVQRRADQWLDTHRTNQSGAIAVFQAAAARQGAVPVIYASTAAVYGANPDMPLSETSVTAPLSAYGADKLGCELQARVASEAYGVPTTGFRIFNVYGPRQDPGAAEAGAVAIFLDRLRRGLPPVIHGDGRQCRDFVFVGDVVEHLIAAIERPDARFRLFNICSGRATSLLAVVDLLSELLGPGPEPHFKPPRPLDVAMSVGSPDLCRHALGLSARTGLREGLAATIAASETGAAGVKLSA